MTGFWELDGKKLRGLQGNAKITVTALQYESRHRQQLTDIHGASQNRQYTGRDLPTHRITFAITGTEDNIYRELKQLQDVIDTLDSPFTQTKDTWTLQAPNELNVYVWKDNKRAAFTTQSLRVEIIHKSKIEVSVDAIMQGIWVADGGDFCETITGSFLLSGTDYILSNGAGLEDQDGDNTGTTPLITLPEQTTGYPTAVNASTFAEDTLSPDSTSTTTIDGNTVNVEVYDLTGYLVPAPVSSGDVGLFEVCSSPSVTYLSGGEGLVGESSEMLDFAFNDITADAVAFFSGASTLDSFAFPDVTGDANAFFVGSSTLTNTLSLITQGGLRLTTQGGSRLVTQSDGFAFKDLTSEPNLLIELITESGEILQTETLETIQAEGQ